MSKPRVLMFIDWYLPGYRAGGPIRSCVNLVEKLRESHDFYILTSDRDYLSEGSYPNITCGEWRAGDYAEQIRYEQANDVTQSKIAALIEDIRPDVIYIHGVFSKTFSILPLRCAKRTNIPVIVAPRGMLRSSALAIKPMKKKLFLLLARISGRYSGVSFHATDRQEQEDIRKRISGQARIILAPNLPRPLPKFSPVPALNGTLRLIFPGRIAPEKNLSFALEVLSGIKDKAIHLDIYGATYDAGYWASCQGQIASMPPNIRVNHHEPIDGAQMLHKLSEYHALFLPTRGENFGHVILESLMASRPVLISDQTPWRGLRASGAGWDVPLSDKEGFRQAMTSLTVMEQGEYDTLCRSAYAFAESYVSDNELTQASKALFLTP